MIEKVKNLKERYIKAISDEEKSLIDAEIQELMNENPDKWAEAMVLSARETADRAEDFVKNEKIREQLENVLPILPLSYIAENYFKKTKQWFYQRLNGNIVNGKPARFTDEEIETLNNAIQDLSKKLGSVRVA